MEESKRGKGLCKVLKSNMHECDELSYYRSLREVNRTVFKDARMFQERKGLG